MLTTTFKKLKAAGACEDRYKHLAKALGGITAYGKDTPITLLQILELNGLDDALWALRASGEAEERDKIARLFACACAERVLPLFEKVYPDDKRPRHAIEVARRYAVGEASKEEMDAARAATWAARAAATWAARAAATCDAAWDAAWAAWAACDAAGAAAGATCDATWAARAARDATWAAARATRDAAGDAGVGASCIVAAWATEREAQKQILINLLGGPDLEHL